VTPPPLCAQRMAAIWQPFGIVLIRSGPTPIDPMSAVTCDIGIRPTPADNPAGYFSTHGTSPGCLALGAVLVLDRVSW
jgi:hypothetical protein